jgi:uncharacterized protein (TIGR03435 family)
MYWEQHQRMEPELVSSRIERVVLRECMNSQPTGTSRILHLALLVLMLTSSLTVKAQPPNPAQSPAAEPERPMAKDAHPVFLVATIKPSDPAAAGEWWAFPDNGRHISALNTPVSALIMLAYRLHPKQIVGAPDWLSKDRYDIIGVPDQPGTPNLPQTQEMYQKLLADRFHLVFHRETRQMPIYAITVAKGGPNLKLADPTESLNTGNRGSDGHRTLKFTNMSIPDFALNIKFYEDRPIIDQTGLTGRYDFTLKWTDDITKEDEPDAPPSIFTAIKEQLGLRVDAIKGPAEVLVIDHIDRPSGN